MMRRLLCLLLLAGCTTTTTDQRRVAKHTVLAAGPTPVASLTDQERVDRHCYKGCPVLNPDFDFGPTVVVARDGYVLEHSSSDKIPLWVAEYVEAAQLTGGAQRRNRFLPDPLLKPGTRAELADYSGSGYDRGHQAPAGNQAADQRLKDETFFLSNMAPQKGALNQRIWKNLEDTTRNWAENAGSAYMITGGFFYDPAEEDVNTADGLINFKTIGKGAVAVPTHFYKIVITTNPDRAVAFVAENRGYQDPTDFAGLIRSIDWLEERSGINFLPELTDAEEQLLEVNASPLW